MRSVSNLPIPAMWRLPNPCCSLRSVILDFDSGSKSTRTMGPYCARSSPPLAHQSPDSILILISNLSMQPCLSICALPRGVGSPLPHYPGLPKFGLNVQYGEEEVASRSASINEERCWRRARASSQAVHRRSLRRHALRHIQLVLFVFLRSLFISKSPLLCILFFFSPQFVALGSGSSNESR